MLLAQPLFDPFLKLATSFISCKCIKEHRLIKHALTNNSNYLRDAKTVFFLRLINVSEVTWVELKVFEVKWEIACVTTNSPSNE